MPLPQGGELQEIGLGLKARTELLRALQELPAAAPSPPPPPRGAPRGADGKARGPPDPGDPRDERNRRASPGEGEVLYSPMGAEVTKDWQVWTKVDGFGKSLKLSTVDSSLALLTAANFSAARPFYLPTARGQVSPCSLLLCCSLLASLLLRATPWGRFHVLHVPCAPCPPCPCAPTVCRQFADSRWFVRVAGCVLLGLRAAGQGELAGAILHD